jgi:heterokaryon incompatibility protein (HET)
MQSKTRTFSTGSTSTQNSIRRDKSLSPRLPAPPVANPPPRAKLKLVTTVKPSSEQKIQLGPLDEPRSNSAKDKPLGRKLVEAAWRKRLQIHKYDVVRADQLRLLIIKPAQDPTAEVEVRLVSLTYDELEEYYEYQALSYHWGDGEAKEPIFIALGGSDTPRSENIQQKQQSIADLVTFIVKKRLYVRSNLYKALQQLRHKSHEVALWVDALCINQIDMTEKKEQIANMAKIYSRADRVCIWLGSADHAGRTDRAMDFIDTIMKTRNLEDLIIPDHALFWSDLIYLMRKSWFSRRWVIQELALAKDAVVRCGSKEVHWRDFSDAIGLFVLHFKDIRKLFKDNDKYPEEYGTMTDLNPLGAKILVDEIANAFLRNSAGELYEPQHTLETLISTLSTFDTSDPRDTVHCLLNLAKETSPFSSRTSVLKDDENPPPEASYTKNLLEVYIDFVRWVVRHSRSLDIICRHWALPERKSKLSDGSYEVLVTLPSWIKLVLESSYGNQLEGFNGRKNGDSFVGLPGARTYNASHGLQPDVRFGADTSKNQQAADPSRTAGASQPKGAQITGPSQSKGTSQAAEAPPSGKSTKRKRQTRSSTKSNKRRAVNVEQTPQPAEVKRPEKVSTMDSSIYVHGLVLSKVTWKTDPIPDGIIPEKGLAMLGWKPKEDEKSFNTVEDRVWRTLVADRGLDGKNPPSWYHRACLRCLVQDTPNGHINTLALLNGKTPPPQMIEEYLKRVQAVTWNRVILEARGNENQPDTFVGIGPPKTELNDLICILYGCSVPCILRPQGNSYTFVGEAYIYGKMDGEAITGLSEHDRMQRTKEFRII